MRLKSLREPASYGQQPKNLPPPHQAYIEVMPAIDILEVGVYTPRADNQEDST